MTSHIDHVADKMAGRKRLSDCESDCTSSSVSEKNANRQLSIYMFKRWQGQEEKEEQKLKLWLELAWKKLS